MSNPSTRPRHARRAQRRFGYTTIGHVTADVLGDGSRRPGGSAFYSALQAARLGRRVLIVTQGVEGEIEQLLSPYRAEFELDLRPARETTALTVGDGRAQRLLAWAGPIADDVRVDSEIVHLAPIAGETPRAWRGTAEFVGVTPQGLVRAWEHKGAEMRPAELTAERLPRRCDAVVISTRERDSCAALLRRPAGGEGPVIAVTAEAAPTELHLGDGATGHVQVPAIGQVVDDVGAGDVFAAAFFVALHEGAAAAQAARFANAAAAVRLAGAGPGAIGERGAVESMLGAAAQAS